MSLTRNPYFCNVWTLKTEKNTALGNIFNFLPIKLNADDPKEEILILLFFLFHNVNIHAFIFTEYLRVQIIFILSGPEGTY